MSLLDRVRALQQRNLRRFRRFRIGNDAVGWIPHRLAERLRRFPKVFEVGEFEVHLAAHLDSFDSRSAAVEEVLRHLEAEGLVKGRRDEDYPVITRFGAPPLMKIERAGVFPFGIRSYGVHMNGYREDKGGLKLWVGRRAKDKATAPGKLDHLVAGGLPIGLSPRENLRKECAEEASIAEDLADRAVPVSLLAYMMETEEGLKNDVLFVYDLAVPADFTPRNADGEIEEFFLWPIEKVREVIADTEDFKFNVGPVIVDFMIRRGLLGPEDPDYTEIAAALRDSTMFDQG